MNNQYNTIESYLSNVKLRLEGENFQIINDVQYMNQRFEFIAERTLFEIDKIAYISTFFAFARFSSLDINSLKSFSTKSYKYARRAILKPLLRWLFISQFCYLVAIVDTIDKDTSEFIRRKAPPKHLTAIEMPVIYSLQSKTLYYCEKTPFWRWLVYDDLRSFINYILTP